MNTRIAILLGLVLSLMPATVAAQTTPPARDAVDSELVTELCSAAADSEAERSACVNAVETAMQEMLQAVDTEEPSLLERAQALIDETAAAFDEALSQAREIDLRAALDEVVQGVEQGIADFELDVDIDVQAAIDEAVAAIEGLDLGIDGDAMTAFENAVAEALASAETIDLQAAVDEALEGARSALDDADLQGTVDDAVAALEESVEEARQVVAAAQVWAQENTEAVCRGGSISLGTTVGIAVFALTGVEWLGLQAFWATERLTNGICGDVVG